MNTDTKNKYLSEAKKYFDRRSHDDDLLKAAISELLNVIADLYEIRKSERDTSLYINNWRNSKLKKTIIVKNEVGKLVEADLDTISWDMSQHDRFLNWLFEFFYKLYEKKTGKTISFAYALDTLTIYHNQQILNKRLLFKKEVDRPNVI